MSTPTKCFIASFLCIATLFAHQCAAAEVDVGICWGRNSWKSLPPSVVVQLLQDNGIRHLKLFNADADIMRALLGTDIQVAPMVSNEFLQIVAGDESGADVWFSRNVQPYLFSNGVKVKEIAVSNEPFLTAYGGQYDALVVPALQNLYNVLKRKGLDDDIKLVVPLNLDILSSSYPPSQAALRTDIRPQVLQIARFLSDTGSRFHINIYPFLTVYQQPPSSPIPLNQVLINDPSVAITSATARIAFIDNGTQLVYTNIFDGAYDAMVTALSNEGFPELEVALGEIGWPSDGQGDNRGYATLRLAESFNSDIVRHLSSGVGTPLRPNRQIHGYLFALVDEDNKTTGPGNFERHWGIFRLDGTPKYPLDLTGTGRQNATLVGAKDIVKLPRRWCVALNNASAEQLAAALGYACGDAKSDCTPIVLGASCYADGDLRKMASYAFNSFYQLHDQDPSACFFGGIAAVTSIDPSTRECHFLIGLPPTTNGAKRFQTVLSQWIRFSFLLGFFTVIFV